MKYKIFLDLDGVCCDFVEALRSKFGFYGGWPEGTYNIDKVLDISDEYLWTSLDFDFWTSMPKTEECDELVELTSKFDTCLLTAFPHYLEGRVREITASGKVNWIKNNLPDFYYDDKFLIGNCKHFCASPRAILIDDSDRKIEKFELAGGYGILFPQLWNKNKHIKEGKVGYVEKALIEIIGEIYES